MLQFLRLFSEFRRLEADRESLLTETDILRSDIVNLHRETLDLRAAKDTAVAESTLNLKRLSNWQAIQAGAAVVPFPDVHIEIRKEESPSDPGMLLPNGFTGRLTRDIQRARVMESRRQASAAAMIAREAAAQVQQARSEADTLGLDDV